MLYERHSDHHHHPHSHHHHPHYQQQQLQEEQLHANQMSSLISSPVLTITNHTNSDMLNSNSTFPSSIPNSIITLPLPVPLQIHIILMTIAFLILFPLGLALGISKHRYHIPIQLFAMTITIIGYICGNLNSSFMGSDLHEGYDYDTTNSIYVSSPAMIYHRFIAIILLCVIPLQFFIGMIRKYTKSLMSSCCHRIIESSTCIDPLKTYVLKQLKGFHSILGKSILIIATLQILFGLVLVTNVCPSSQEEEDDKFMINQIPISMNMIQCGLKVSMTAMWIWIAFSILMTSISLSSRISSRPFIPSIHRNHDYDSGSDSDYTTPMTRNDIMNSEINMNTTDHALTSTTSSHEIQSSIPNSTSSTSTFIASCCARDGFRHGIMFCIMGCISFLLHMDQGYREIYLIGGLFTLLISLPQLQSILKNNNPGPGLTLIWNGCLRCFRTFHHTTTITSTMTTTPIMTESSHTNQTHPIMNELMELNQYIMGFAFIAAGICMLGTGFLVSLLTDKLSYSSLRPTSSTTSSTTTTTTTSSSSLSLLSSSFRSSDSLVEFSSTSTPTNNLISPSITTSKRNMIMVYTSLITSFFMTLMGTSTLSSLWTLSPISKELFSGILIAITFGIWIFEFIMIIIIVKLVPTHSVNVSDNNNNYDDKHDGDDDHDDDNQRDGYISVVEYSRSSSASWLSG